jgi:hypothetical protein
MVSVNSGFACPPRAQSERRASSESAKQGCTRDKGRQQIRKRAKERSRQRKLPDE